jgi:hypothetical protein
LIVPQTSLFIKPPQTIVASSMDGLKILFPCQFFY